jgi:hypothetical protein
MKAPTLLVAITWATAVCAHDKATPKAETIVLKNGDREVLAYQAAHSPSPDPAQPWFGRSGFIHPVRTPAGRIVTNDFPYDHLHQHGIMMAWTSSVVDGRKIDFWNSKKQQGRIEHVKTVQAGEDRITVKLRHLDITGTKPRVVLRESWELIRVPHPTMHVFDLVSTQTNVAGTPVVLAKYHYGGLCVRGSEAWRTNGDFLTSEGKTRADGNHSRPRWVAMHGKIDDAGCGLACLGHPDNFRAPQPARLHPEFPYFSFAPMVTGEFTIAPGRPYVSRYRFAAFDGAPDSAKLDALWNDYAGRPEAP